MIYIITVWIYCTSIDILIASNHENLAKSPKQGWCTKTWAWASNYVLAKIQSEKCSIFANIQLKINVMISFMDNCISSEFDHNLPGNWPIGGALNALQRHLLYHFDSFTIYCGGRCLLPSWTFSKKLAKGSWAESQAWGIKLGKVW